MTSRRSSPTTLIPPGDELGGYRGRRVLVTGGMGFIGSHLTCRLLAAGAEVMVIDNDVSVERRSLLRQPPYAAHPSLTVVELDVCDRAAVTRLFDSGSSFDFVFHLAGYSVIERSTQFPYDSLHTNAIGTLHILDAVRGCHRAPRRIVISSTDKVYGEMDGASYLEDSPLRGIGLYDAGKLAADVIARSYAHTFDSPICVVRLCNVFGPHDYNVGYRLFPKSLSRIFEHDAPLPPILYYESLGHWRDYAYIDDVVSVLLMTATEDTARGEVFNMPAAKHISTPVLLKELTDASVRALEPIDPRRAALVESNGIMIATNAQSALTIERQHLDSTKIATLLGVKTGVSYEEGLRRTVAHHASALAGRLARVH